MVLDKLDKQEEVTYIRMTHNPKGVNLLGTAQEPDHKMCISSCYLYVLPHSMLKKKKTGWP